MSANATSATAADEQALIDKAKELTKSSFDYIIVGSGAGGGPLACRLALARKKVLLIEAGGDPKDELRKAAQEDLGKRGKHARFQDPDDAVVLGEAPLFHGASTEEPCLSWSFSVRHYDDDARQFADHKYDPTRDPSNHGHLESVTNPNDPLQKIPLAGSPVGKKGKGGIFYPRSSGIGGCTAHHAMIVIRPNDHDWDEIARLTNDSSWSAKNMQPYFARMEQCLYVEEYVGFLAKLLGWFFKGFLAVMRFINPKSVLDEGGHGKKGWQPTSFISLALVQKIVNTDRELTTVLIKSAFKVIEGSGPLTATLKRFLITLGFVRSLDPNDNSTRASNPNGGVFLIPTGTGGEGGGGKAGDPVVDELGNSLKGSRVGVREFILKTQKEVNAKPECEGRLIIEKGVHVKRVLFDNSTPPRAVGVIGVKGDHLYRASPKHGLATPGDDQAYYIRHAKTKSDKGEIISGPALGEVILCGGAFNTPQLLMLSGIGPADQLAAHGIRPKAVLPGVGRNLQDRYEVTVVSELKDSFESLDTVAFDPASATDKLLAEWRKTRTGLYTSNGGTLAIMQRSSAADPERPGPDLLTFGAPATFRGYYWNYSKQLLRPYKDAPNDQTNLWTWVILKAYTRNNGGTVRLRSADPFDTPDICFHSFDEGLKHGSIEGWEQDIDALAETVEAMRAINAQPGSPFRREIQPAEYCAAKNMTLRDWIKNEAWGHHACGTCRIGSDKWQKDVCNLTDKSAVLDSHFRVHGIAGLRVVDASVFPNIPGYFILAPIFMMSEKAAETILTEGICATYPDAISDFELNAIQTRRAHAWVDDNNRLIDAKERPMPGTSSSASDPAGGACRGEVNAEPVPARESNGEPTLARESIVGLALSGGGVRSATFALGVLQAIAKKGKLRHIDYLSTVSGGGFIGSFLGRLFTRKGVADVADPCSRAEELLSFNGSGPLRWLRTQANYLFAKGTDDYLITAAVFFRNIFTVHLVIGAMLVAVFGMLAGIAQLPFYQRLIPQAPGLHAWHDIQPVLSLWWWLPVAMLVVVILPMKLGYWLAPKPQSYRSHPPYPLAAWLILIGAASLMLSLPGAGKYAGGALLVVLGLSWLWQEVARHGLSEADVSACRAEGPLVRNRLTRGLGEALAIFLILILWVVLDSLARTIADIHRLPAMISALLALSPTLHALRTRAMALLPKSDAPESFTKEKVVAVVIASALLFLADVIAHTLFLALEPKWAWGGVAIALAFSAVIGRAFDLLNYTSIHESYASRIKRTYLGASNPERTQGADSTAADVQIVHPGDDLPHSKYRPEQHGGPLHLISVCVNETVDHASQREIRERKGLPMAIGSFGVSVGLRYFAQWSDTIDEPCWLKARRHFEGIDRDGAISPTLAPIRLDSDPNTFHPLGRRDDRPAVVQSLSLGDWIAVSGAAFSTGNGRATNPLLSLFMGLTNVRLGFWWDSGIKATERPGRFPANAWRRIKELPGAIFRAQQLLLSEWRGRFDGPSHEFWNLSDGGHFETTAAYELIRRKVPFIICIDGTLDPGYSFDETANLVRLVRVDFGAEMKWVDPGKFGTKDYPAPPKHIADRMDMNNVGTLDDIRGQGNAKALAAKHAALACVTYGGDEKPGTWMLLIKASLVGDESLDIRQYAGAHKAFPQDPTMDQVFDDEQWESYRKLGEKAGTLVIQ